MAREKLQLDTVNIYICKKLGQNPFSKVMAALRTQMKFLKYINYRVQLALAQLPRGPSSSVAEIKLYVDIKLQFTFFFFFSFFERELNSSSM